MSTKDRPEALRRVRIEAVRVDNLFDAHREDIAAQQLRASAAPLDELTAEQLARVKQAYPHHLLDEDEEVRLEGFHDTDDAEAVLSDLPRPSFEEGEALRGDMDAVTRTNLSRGKKDEFLLSQCPSAAGVTDDIGEKLTGIHEKK